MHKLPPRITETPPWQMPTPYFAGLSPQLGKLLSRWDWCLTQMPRAARQSAQAISCPDNKLLSLISNFPGPTSFDNHGDVPESHEKCLDRAQVVQNCV
jgi:hypothetical protein